MAIDDRFDAEQNLLLITFAGRVDDDDLVRFAQRAARNPEIPGPRKELIDLTAVELSDVQSHTLRRIAELFASTDETPEQSRVAIAATADVAYGLSRMYQAFRAGSRLPLQVFRTVAEARTWLELDEA